MTEEILWVNDNLLFLMDILGTFAFACSGALAGIAKRFDPVGVVVLAFVTAIGGGTLRDILIGNFPVLWLKNDIAIVVISIAAIIAMLAGKWLQKIPYILFIFDAIGLGLFTIYGIELGLKSGLSIEICIALGTITACFGGVIRDVLLNTVPLIFYHEIYVMACVAGAVLYFILGALGVHLFWTRIFSMLLIILIRIVVVKYHLSLPKFYLKR
ncbi:MAG: trimeric intracellular cation channel family protein [Chitinophagales bacterium]|nr:trimeric intracellular cation channel family protein [Chitinophagales bacterium]MCZ2392351.1 trimeric intracellular cation channel family protein [Chitinophagales bacterium]